MRSQNFLFIIFCLILLTGLMQSYAVFQNHFSPHQFDQNKISQLKIKLEKEKLQTVLAKNQLYDFQQQLASEIPQLESIKKDSSSFQLRNLASVSQAPINGFDLSKSLIEKAKADFRDGKFESAAVAFSKVTSKYPTSPQIVEAYFFLGESYFMSQKGQECMDVVDKMMTHYPDHELTGFLMLRMGQLLQARGRSDEAVEVFGLVADKFAFNQELKAQARQLEKSSE